MTAQPLTQRVARAVGEGCGCLFHWGAYGIEELVRGENGQHKF